MAVGVSISLFPGRFRVGLESDFELPPGAAGDAQVKYGWGTLGVRFHFDQIDACAPRPVLQESGNNMPVDQPRHSSSKSQTGGS